MTHANFDLLFSKTGEKTYCVRVVGSSAGTAAAQFTNPFAEFELENLMLRLGQARRGLRRAHTPPLGPVKTLGQRLFDTVFTGEVRDCYRACLSYVSAERGVRIRLRLTEVPELAGWPWEFLYDSSGGNFLGLSKETPIVRYLDLPEPIQPLQASPPLRILLMVSSPTDHAPLDVEQEVSKVTQSLADVTSVGLVVVERVNVATVGQLQRMLRHGSYHIFHFIGHGALSPDAGESVLIFEDEQERGRPVPASTLGVLLHDHRTLRVAVLNACEGARAFDHDPFSGVAQKLVQQGVPAVVAMQSPISDEAAIRFSHEFYAALGYGYSVDNALAEARKAIYADVDELEWATPVLYMRADDARIFSGLPRQEPSSPRMSDARARGAPAIPASPAGAATAAKETTLTTPAILWGAATLVSLLTALLFTALGARQRWFNLFGPQNAVALLPLFGLVTSSVGYLFTALVFLLTRRPSLSPARFARWTSLTAEGTPSVARFTAFAVAAAAAAWWYVSSPPTLAIAAREMPFPASHSRIVEDLEELVYHEVQWHIGAGSSSNDLKVQVLLRTSQPVYTVFFGRAQVIETSGDTERVRDLQPPPIGQPLVITWGGPTPIGRPGRLQFTIARELTVEEHTSHVEIDVQIIRNETEAASRCARVVEQWTHVRLDAEPDDCSPLP